jgi:uncharacterized protein YbjT (DUF2867 family)
MYAVVGATGNTGSVVASSLLQQGESVRVIGRNADRLARFAGMGADVFVGSVADPDAAAEAFAGARGAYVMVPPDYAATDFRAYQRAVGEAIASGIAAAGVEYVLSLSSVGAQHAAGTGPIAGLHEFENRLNELPGKTLHLRAAYFMENFLIALDAVRSMGVMGTPLRPDIPIPMIATRDIGDVAARRLAALDFKGKSARELLGPREYTLEEATRILGESIGMPDLPYVQFPYEAAAEAFVAMGVHPETAGVFTEMYQAFNEGRVTPEEERSDRNTTPTTLEEFSVGLAAAFGTAG